MNCQGTICIADPEKELRIWWPGEPVCSSSPATKWQKVQRRLNIRLRKGTLKNSFTYYFLDTLKKIKSVTNSTSGILSETELTGNTVKGKQKASFTPRVKGDIAKLSIWSSEHETSRFSGITGS